MRIQQPPVDPLLQQLLAQVLDQRRVSLDDYDELGCDAVLVSASIATVPWR